MLLPIDSERELHAIEAPELDFDLAWSELARAFGIHVLRSRAA